MVHSIFLFDSAAAGHRKDNYKDSNDQLFSESVMDRVKANGPSMQREHQDAKKDKLDYWLLKIRTGKQKACNVPA